VLGLSLLRNLDISFDMDRNEIRCKCFLIGLTSDDNDIGGSD
jgi:hypothetical protein